MEEGRELPVGWTVCDLGDVGEIIRGITFPASAKEQSKTEDNVGCLRTSNIQREVDWRNVYFVSKTFVKKPSQLVRVDDVLMSMANSYELVGKVSVARELPHETAFGAFLAALRPTPALADQFLFHFLRSESVQRQIREGSSQTTNIANVSAARLREIAIPLAPLNEQRRIAAKLDTTLAAVDACRQRLDGVEALLKRFRQAVLAAATSGELTREWREERGIADEWNAAQLGPLLNDMRYGTAKKCSYEAVGLPVLRIPNILESGCICQADLKYADFDAQEVAKLSLLPGDLLVIRSNGSLDLVGRVAEASKKDAGLLFAGYLIRLRPNQDKLLSPYLLLVLRAPSTRNAIELAARSTSGVNNINSQFLSSLVIPLPAIPEQQEIVRRTQALFTLADQLESRLTSARKIVDRLTPALLAKAFRGELVPQDPGDESASALLARIWAARQAEAGAGKPSRRGRKKAATTLDPITLAAAPVQPDLLSGILRECGALSELALLAASELDPRKFRQQLAQDIAHGVVREIDEDGLELLEVVP